MGSICLAQKWVTQELLHALGPGVDPPGDLRVTLGLSADTPLPSQAPTIFTPASPASGPAAGIAVILSGDSYAVGDYFGFRHSLHHG